jgi:aerobic carbon-monoxide dehydrogenase large subunit
VGVVTSGRFVGRPLRRLEDERILRGRSQFLDDIRLDGTAHVAFVRSPHARARVLGVRGPKDAMLVITAAELDGTSPPEPTAPPGVELADAPHPLLARDEVRYVGQPVAAVVAESRAAAEDLAELVEVDYEPLDAVVDPRAGEVLMRWERSAGDVAGAFASAAHVVRSDHVIPRLAAVPMETRGALATRDGDLLTVWSSSQGAHRPRAQLAQMLGLPESSLRVRVPDVGGAFGSKGVLPVETALVALAALELGRPVKWVEDRRENFLAAPQGRGARGAVELALDADGRFLALRGRLLADLGAYLLPSTAIPAHTMAMLLPGAYDIPAVAVTLTGARTDKVPVAPYRGAGRPEAIYLIETTVDAAARVLGVDPAELRRRNLVRSFPYETALGWTYDSGDYERCLDRALELIAPEHIRDGDVLVGTGVCVSVERSAGLWETAEVRLADGRAVVRVGSTPSGQGHETLFAQIAAEHLDLELADIEVLTGDSARLPDSIGSFASRSTAMGGSAVALACEEALADADGVGFASFESDQAFTSGACAAVVAVERATGRLTVRRIAAVDDAGRIVNPLLAEGQVIGATVAGLGAVLTEEVVHDEEGQPVSSSLLDYGLLTAAELPPLTTEFVESPSPLNPLGAKGIGEAGTIATPPAIANALADALGGRHIDPPFTAEKIWRALQ